MSELNYTCLKWDIEDIKAAALFANTELTDEQAEALLHEFFEENNEYIIETINITMQDFCWEKFRPDLKDQ
jgi:hypothetical protein